MGDRAKLALLLPGSRLDFAKFRSGTIFFFTPYKPQPSQSRSGSGVSLLFNALNYVEREIVSLKR